MTHAIFQLEMDLNNFDPKIRYRAVNELSQLVHDGRVQVNPEENIFNLHCHSFNSYNAYGYSPSGLAWVAKKHGFRQIGIVDFDVLDGVDELFFACDQFNVRCSAGIETRVFIPEFSTREINSPGEPGIYYYMGIGFVAGAVPPPVQEIMDSMRSRAYQRNREIVSRLNPFLAPLSIQYDQDVLPLTPGGNATERHILAAYLKASSELGEKEASFWSEKLSVDAEKIDIEMKDPAGFQNLVRTRLMKKGGVGYIQPGPTSFPEPEEVHRLIQACGALPCATWLDGTSAGEQAMRELLEILITGGIAALNIIPDRNWNIKDPEIRKTKVAHLYHLVELAINLDLPLNIGTEMNSFGQKLVDTFTAPEMVPLQALFLDGANFIYGHTMLQRGAGLGYQSDWAKQNLLSRKQRNKFYQLAGSLIPPGKKGLSLISVLNSSFSPEHIIEKLNHQVPAHQEQIIS
jgi:hypothetical protein